MNYEEEMIKKNLYVMIRLLLPLLVGLFLFSACQNESPVYNQQNKSNINPKTMKIYLNTSGRV